MRIILDLCGGTGSWSKPYKETGYYVLNITLPEYDVRSFEFPDYKVHGILAAPPCIAFSMLRNFHAKRETEKQRTDGFIDGLAIVDACLRIIMICKPKWWVLENPKNYLRRWLGKPDFEFDPWEFGDNYQKRTYLWGNFNHPAKTIKEKPEGLIKFAHLPSKDIHPEHYGTLDRQTRRAITPPGFAKAFFEANP